MIDTNRLFIRNLIQSDYHKMIEYMGDKHNLRYEPDDEYDLEKLSKFTKEVEESKLFYVCFIKNTDILIGHIYLEKTDPSIFNGGNIGYIFNPKFHGLGFATEAAKAVMNYGFNNLGMHRIIAMCNPENIPSWKVMEKLNMRKEGHFKKKVHFRDDDEGNPIYWDEYVYAILKEDFLKTKG